MAALAESGRRVSPTELANWRKNGLLPPLTAHGLGAGKGKTYCWHDQGIVARAVTIFDALKKHGRTDQAILTLFLSGFDISLPKLRRAWAAHMRRRGGRRINLAQSGSVDTRDAQSHPLQPVLAVSAAIQRDDVSPFAIRAMEHGLARLGYGMRGSAARFCHLLGVMAVALEATDVVGNADITELYEARRMLNEIIDFLDRGMGKRGQLMEAVGPLFFVFILALLGSGQSAAMEKFLVRMRKTGRPASVRPARAFDPAAQSVNAAE